MSKIQSLFLIVSVVFTSLAFSSARAEQSLILQKSYSRGDDDLAYTYRTAYLGTSLILKKVSSGYEASIEFSATMSTPEAQGFAESVRFGMREAERRFKASETQAFVSEKIRTEPVRFQFDAETQQLAEGLSAQAYRNGGGIAGNQAEALNKTLRGNLVLGVLGEGAHEGTLFVQQLTGMTPSQTDTDISVRHLLRWHVTVDQGQVAVELRNGRYFQSDARIDIAAPAWDGTVRPHRVSLLKDEAVIDGRLFPSGSAQIGAAHGEKAATLIRQDKAEFKREYPTVKERVAARREERRSRGK